MGPPLSFTDTVGPAAATVCWIVLAASPPGGVRTAFFIVGLAVQGAWLMAAFTVAGDAFQPPDLSLREYVAKKVLSISVLSGWALAGVAISAWIALAGFPVDAASVGAAGPAFVAIIALLRAYFLVRARRHWAHHPEDGEMSWIHCSHLERRLWAPESTRRSLRLIRERISITVGKRLGLSRAALLPVLEKTSLDPSSFLVEEVTLYYPSRIDKTAYSLAGLPDLYILDGRFVRLAREGIVDADREEGEAADAHLKAATSGSPLDLKRLYAFYLGNVDKQPVGGRRAVDMLRTCPGCPDVAPWVTGAT